MRRSHLACLQARRTSETNQRALPEHVVSAAVTSATCAHTLPHGNLTGTCHSVQVLSDSKVKHTSQPYHEPLNSVFATHALQYIYDVDVHLLFCFEFDLYITRFQCHV